MNTPPLVTVAVICYNASTTIIETLESIKSQSYSNIELVISDDFSKDDTVEKCANWIEINKRKFVSCILLSSNKNTGVSANINRALKAARGEWIKLIADDLLEPDCIQHYVNYINNNSDVDILFAKSISFDNNTRNLLRERPAKDFLLPDTPHGQYIKLIKKDFVNPVTVFYRKRFMESIGYINEAYPFMDDYPTWLKILKKGSKFYYMPVVTVKYRITGSSLSSSLKMGKISQLWLDSATSFFKKELSKELKENKCYAVLILLKIRFCMQNKCNKADNKYIYYFYKLFASIVNKLYSKLI